MFAYGLDKFPLAVVRVREMNGRGTTAAAPTDLLLEAAEALEEAGDMVERLGVIVGRLSVAVALAAEVVERTPNLS